MSKAEQRAKLVKVLKEANKARAEADKIWAEADKALDKFDEDNKDD